MVYSHLGRPVEGEPKAEQSLAPVAAYLTEALGQEVKLSQTIWTVLKFSRVKWFYWKTAAST